jgi:hypothetical protein
MTILSLEDSKALYDIGIKIETKYGYPCKFLNPDEFIDTPWLLDDAVPMKRHALPAPDLEELLEYAKKYIKSPVEHLMIEYVQANNTWIATFWDDLGEIMRDGVTPIQALANLLLKLKEEGYEV